MNIANPNQITHQNKKIWTMKNTCPGFSWVPVFSHVRNLIWRHNEWSSLQKLERCVFRTVPTILWSRIKLLTKTRNGSPRQVPRNRTVRNVLCTIGTFRTTQLHKVFRTSRLRTMKNTCSGFLYCEVRSNYTLVKKLDIIKSWTCVFHCAKPGGSKNFVKLDGSESADDVKDFSNRPVSRSFSCESG